MQTVNMRKKGGRSGRMDEELIYEILSVVEEIPEGRVASYGQIAELIGRRKNARLVGCLQKKQILACSFTGKTTSCLAQCVFIFIVFVKQRRTV